MSENGDHQAATRAQRGGDRLIGGRYLLQDVLGQGGMGTVWRAHDHVLDRPVAAKELHVLAHGDDQHRIRVRRAVREARAVARVSHQHIIGVYDLIESDDQLWIVMELVEGPSLARQIAQGGPLRQVVDALLHKSPDERPSAARARSVLVRIAAGETDVGDLPSATVREARAALSLADANTMTIGRDQQLVAHGTATSTAVHTTSFASTEEHSSRRPGRKRLWWALAGTSVLVAAAGSAAFFTGMPPFTEGNVEKDPKATVVNQVIQAASGWQNVAGLSLRKGDRVTVRFVDGEWTVDFRNKPMTGPAGYDAATDQSLDGAKACKLEPSSPFATLLARFGDSKTSPVHAVNQKLTLRATANGPLQLGINDAVGSCSDDNKGALAVEVTVTRP
ncbi:protein kinase [Streptomyces chartreusis]|uniref:protein kinase domain-containing protein n=1 Tax=Streptomyces chartreusis TaxID=1969 RepID=UPI00367486E1